MALRAAPSSPMKASPMSAESAGAVGLYKLGAALGVGVVGAACIAAFDPPKTKRELFTQAASAGAVSILFGNAATKLADAWFTSLTYDDLHLPVCFLVGALSWGALGALAKLRTMIRERGADAVAGKAGL